MICCQMCRSDTYLLSLISSLLSPLSDLIDYSVVKEQAKILLRLDYSLKHWKTAKQIPFRIKFEITGVVGVKVVC